MTPIMYDGDNFFAVQQHLGKRPGDYTIDSYYLREGWGNKPFFWDSRTRKWLKVTVGDTFYEKEGFIRKTAYTEVSNGKA